MARADGEIRRAGLPGGARSILRDFGLEPVVWGAGRVPEAGPLIIASNHPGAYDSLAIMASVPRPDLKVVISDVGFTRALAAAGQHFVYARNTPAGRAQALRISLRHLAGGGALLIYPHTEVEPDPETGAGAAEALGEWSRSLEIMLRRVPGTRLQVAIASGILLPRFIRQSARQDPPEPGPAPEAGRIPAGQLADDVPAAGQTPHPSVLRGPGRRERSSGRRRDAGRRSGSRAACSKPTSRPSARRRDNAYRQRSSPHGQ